MKKVCSVLSILVIMLLTLTTIVKADSIIFTATGDKTKAKAGDTVTINLKLSEISAGEKGINTFQCKLTYDKDVFEDVQVNSKNNWSLTYNNESGSAEEGTLLAVILQEGVKEDQEIGTVTLKVKDGVKKQTSNIEFTDAFSNNGTENINTQNQTISIAIDGIEENNGNNNDENNQVDNNTTNNTQTGDNQSNNVTNTIVGNNDSKNVVDNSISNTPLPQTGVNGGIIFAVVLAVAAIALFVYIRYKKINK